MSAKRAVSMLAGSWRKKAKEAAGSCSARPDIVRRQNFIRESTSGKIPARFSKSYNAANEDVVTRSLKKNWVVASVAIPVGTITPERPWGAVRLRNSSANTA